MMPNPDERLKQQWEAMQSINHSSSPADARPLSFGGGDGTFSPMETRVTRLELQMEQVGRTLGSIDGKLDKVNDRLLQLPTKSDLSGWKLQWTALALAVVAVVIGGIIGGLAWIQPEPAPTAPTIITVPSARS